MLWWDWNELVLHRYTPYPSLSDLAYATTPALTIVGLFYYRSDSPSRPVTLMQLGDLGLLMCAATISTALLLYNPEQAANQSPLYVWTALAHTIMHVSALLFGMLRMWQVPRGDGRRLVLMTLLAAITSQTLGATLYSRGLLIGVWTTGSNVDALWVLTFAFVIVATIVELHRTSTEQVPQDLPEMDGAVTVGSVAVVGLTLLVTHHHGTSSQFHIMGFGLIGLAVALGARYRGSTLIERELKARLVRLNASLEQRVEVRTAELKVARDAALEASRSKSRFLANMSHELRTPLSGVLGYAELIGEELAEGDVQAAAADAQHVHIAGSQLMHLINELLDLARVESGKDPIQCEETALNEVFDELRVLTAPLIRANENTLEVFIHSDVPALFTDHGRLRQIVLNLLSNANKFTTAGSIRLAATFEDNWVTITVTDSGVGMRKEALNRIFEPFERAHDAEDAPTPGTGLGLSISHSLAELLGGGLHATSELGEGTTMILTLPLRSPACS